MFPNPHDALPLPPKPNLDHYKKRAKDLLKASRSTDPKALQTWAADWIESLVCLSNNTPVSNNSSVILNEVAAQRSSAATPSKDPMPAGSSNSPKKSSHNWLIPTQQATQLATFAREKLSRTPALTAAQFVIARAHGFESWPQLVKHIESRADSAVKQWLECRA